jgi:hypothetical protein
MKKEAVTVRQQRGLSKFMKKLYAEKGWTQSPRWWEVKRWGKHVHLARTQEEAEEYPANLPRKAKRRRAALAAALHITGFFQLILAAVPRRRQSGGQSGRQNGVRNYRGGADEKRPFDLDGSRANASFSEENQQRNGANGASDANWRLSGGGGFLVS